MRIKTWMIEALVVAVVLSVLTIVTGAHIREWIGSIAVLFSFMQAQVADRMSEKEATREVPEVPCFKWSGRYFLLKEVCWFSYFAMSQTYAALCGCVLFLLYPAWRKAYRSLHPRI